jgi:hypothetical protein
MSLARDEALFLYHQFVDTANKLMISSSPNPQLAADYATYYKKMEQKVQELEQETMVEEDTPELLERKQELELALYEKNKELQNLIYQTRMILQLISATPQKETK